MNKQFILGLLALTSTPFVLQAADEARLLRFPATNGSEIVFSYAGDLYYLLREKDSNLRNH
jgi:tricorn protease